MKEYMQVKQIDVQSTTDDLNVTLKELGTRVISVTPVYNDWLTCIHYVIVYWC